MSNKQINFIGWILFILSAIGFVIASIGSFWSMVGSILVFGGLLGLFDTVLSTGRVICQPRLSRLIGDLLMS